MTQPCPRSPSGQGDPGPFTRMMSGVDSHWDTDDTCSYCGSLNNDLLIRRLRQNDVEVGPTDKSYKIYVRNAGGDPFRQRYRNCPRHSESHLPEDCDHWVTREVQETKFYFQHFTDEQMREFVYMMNSGLLSMGAPGYFYTLPFFVSRNR